MSANATSAVAEFRRLLEKKKAVAVQPVKRKRGMGTPFEEGEEAATVAIEVFKKELEKIK